ncbi:MAG: hypothetical protein AAF899_09120 [Pseudomonadota bacterium]
MKPLGHHDLRLLLLGAGLRLGVAAAIIALLWAGFFWATGDVGPG